jgi:uncharacterized protein (TIGR02453 family)
MAAFAPEALRFLRDLEKHNDREWFQSRKDKYDELVRGPMIALVQSVNAGLANQGPDYVTDPAKSVYRIYRDTRFSPDKTPYKTHIGALLWHRKLGKGGGAALYFHVSTKELLIAAGLYHTPPELLTPVRHHIAANHQRLRAVLNRKVVKSEFGDLQGDSLSRPPKGWPADHPAVDLLKQKDLLLEVQLDPKLALRDDVGREITRRLRLALPFVEFLNEPLLKQQAKPKDPLFVD